MRVYQEISFEDFEAWSGAVDTKEKIIDAGKAEEFEALVEELFPNGIDATELNDFLWFDDDYILEILGITEEDEEDE